MTLYTLDNAELVGSGRAAEVFAWGDGRVLKLFRRPDDPAAAEREFASTRAVHALGIPVPSAYEVIEVAGRYGIVFERVGGPSLIQYVQARPWALFRAANLLAELHARLHGCAAPAELPSQHELLHARINAATDHPEAERDAAHRMLAALPTGTALCHGDFHPGNILMTGRGAVIIDWERAARGHPVGDVAYTSRLFRRAGLPERTPAHIRLLFTASRALLHRAYLHRYLRLRPGSREQVAQWELPLGVMAPTWRGALTGSTGSK
jgi:uncharacterized protein (TIGR02172 family)